MVCVITGIFFGGESFFLVGDFSREGGGTVFKNIYKPVSDPIVKENHIGSEVSTDNHTYSHTNRNIGILLLLHKDI